MRKLLAVLMFVICASAIAQNTPVTVQSKTTGISSASSTVAFSVNVTVGDALYAVMFDGNGSGDTLTFTDSQGNSWTTSAIASLSTDGDTIAVGCAVASNTGADTITFKVNGSASASFGSIYEVSGASCNPDGSAVSLNSQNAASCNSGALSTSIHNDFLIGFCATANAFNSLVGGGTGWSHLLSSGVDGYYDALSEIEIASTTGSYTATSAPFPTNSEQATIEVAFKATSSSICGQPAQSGIDNENALYEVATPCVTGPNSGGYTVSNISYWVGSPASTSFDLGVYSDSSGSANSLLCSVSTGTITPSSGWNSVSISGCPALAANTTYWVGYITGSNAIEQGTASGICPGTANYYSAWANSVQSGVSLSNPFGASSADTHCYSIYMNLSIVNLSVPTLTVSSSLSPSAYQQSVTFTATISNSLTGTVIFYDAGSSIGTGTISGSTATLTTSSLTAGSHSITAGWAGNSSYSSITSQAIAQTVNQATPQITWSNPAPIANGVALSSTQLNATANVPGSFSYSPASGAVLPPGMQTLSATFTPTDAIDYATVTTTVTLTVSMAPNSGIIVTIAGDGYSGFTGDGGPANLAKLSNPVGVAIDSSGNVYFSDYSNDRIRKVDASTGNISTIGGNGTVGYSGDGGPAVNAELLAPTGVASDAAGNIYFADGGVTVRKITASTGIISTVAGNGSWGFLGDGGPATSAEFGGDMDIAVDSAGNLYIADKYNMRIRKVSAATGIITTVAGNGTSGYSGNGSLATSAELNWPSGVTVDAVGNLYIADLGNNMIRKVAASTGIITTVAGNGTAGYTGNGGSATSAELNAPYDVAVDAAGNLYISDANNFVIRQVAAGTGTITTIAGNGTQGYSGDGGPATSAQLGAPWDVATDANGDVFIADYYACVIRMVGSSVTEPSTTSPTISWQTPAAIPYGTALGSAQLNATANVPGTFTYTPAAGPVLQAGLYSLSVLFTPTDTVHYGSMMATVPLTVTQAQPTITWPAPAPIVYGAALSATQLNATSNVPGTLTYTPGAGTVPNAGLQSLSVTFTPVDTVDYASAVASATLTVSLTPGPGIITTVAGDGNDVSSGDGGLAINAQVPSPEGIAVDSAGNIYIPDSSIGVVRKVTASTGIISTIAGTGTQGYAGDGGQATSAELNTPMDIALDAAGNVYIADFQNNRIRKITISTGVITTVAGTGTAGYSGDSGAATSAELSNPLGIAFDSAGNLYIADTGNSIVRKVAASTGFITTAAGNRSPGYSGDGGPATSAEFFEPGSVAFDSSGNFYVADLGNNVVRKVTIATGIISTIGGDGTAGYSGDGGAATSAELNDPVSVAVDANGNVFITEYNNNVIRLVSAATGTISTIAGNGTNGYSGDGGPATSAQLSYPHGVALDSAGNLYIGDCGNHRVRMVGNVTLTTVSVSVSPTSATLNASQQRQFIATVTNTSNTGVTWSIGPSGAGTVSASGLYTAPATIATEQTVTVTATSQANTAVSASATVTLMPNISVSVSPATVSLYGGQTQSFSATVANTSNTAVAWSISPSATGSIDESGNYTAPTTVATQTVVTVTATSQADTTKAATATVYLLPPCVSNGYTYVRTIVIDHTKVPNTDQTNFPFLFSTTDPAFRSTANGGHLTNTSSYDIIFTSDPQGLTKLDYEIEEYNAASGQVIAWVRIPVLSHTSDTVLYMFYGNASIASSQQNPGGVWGNYMGTWHLPNGTTLSAIDSTSNGNNGILEGGVGATSGIVDGAAVLDGTTGYIATSNLMSGPSVYSLSLWFKTTTNQGGRLAGFGSSQTGGSGGFDRHLYMTNTGQIIYGNWNGGAVAIISPSSYNDGSWHLAVGTLSSTGQYLYVDGKLVAGSSNNQAQVYSGYWRIGVDNLSLWPDAPSSSYLAGSVDEVRVSNLAESRDWVSSEYNNQASPSTFYSLESEMTMLVSPPAVSLYSSQSQQFAVSFACGSPPVWSIPTGAPGTLSGDGLYLAPASIPSPQNVTISATSTSDPTKMGTATVTLLPNPSDPALTLSATVQSPYVTGTTQQFLAIFTSHDGSPLSGAAVTFTVSGSNPTTGSSTTDASGIATFAYAGGSSGNDTIQASASLSGVQASSNTVTATWIVPVQSISTTSVLGTFFFYNPDTDYEYSFNTPPTAVPAFSQVFPNIAFNPPTGAIPGNTSGVEIHAHPFTDVTTDENGNFTGTIIAQGNGYQAGLIASGTGPEGFVQNQGIFQAVFTGSYIVPSAGDAVINVFVDNTFILGIGGGATSVSGYSPLTSGETTTPFEQFPIMGNSGFGNSIGSFAMTVHFPAAGTYPYELDYVECCGGGGGDSLSLVMSASLPNGTTSGVPPTGLLILSPGSVNPLPVGGQQSFTVTATDASGSPVPNLQVGLVVSLADSLELNATTDSNGIATFIYHNVDPGTATVQAVAFIDGMITYSNQASVPWTLPPTTTSSSGESGSLVISIDAPNTVILPNTLQLGGSSTDNSLPSGDSITTTWSQVSGPGTTTFANPQQISTTASFSEPGTYELKLAASDVNGSASANLNVAVNPAPGVTQGWIGSPTYGSSVSCIVPITVATGETLQSGVLSVYPANNPNSVTILNADTTGSGQIGTWDTTVLNNGSYWVTLQATDTTGTSEYNLALVTVTGNCKPGRITSTVTDLVVPANGLAINIQRTYDSLNASTIGDFGYGWNLSTNVNLTVGPKGDVTFTLGGIRRTFYLTPVYDGFLPFYDVLYTPEPGLHGTLTSNGAGCSDQFGYVVPDGSLWYCLGGGLYSPAGYIYTDPSGTAYAIGANGNLQLIVDKNGNSLTINANGITSSTGLSVPFVRDSSGRITKITDPQGNNYLYSYDDSGNLATVTYPATPTSQICPGLTTSNTSQYAYYPNSEHPSYPAHFYAGGTDARCNLLPVTDYYGQSDVDTNGLPLSGRLKSVTDALSETTSYAYNLATDTTTITYPQDAGGNVGTATMVYDTSGDLLSSTDPLGHTTTNTYDANLNLLTTTDPLGKVTSYTYDSNGNKTSTTYPATATSTNTNSTSAYNQYSEPTSTTDELGNLRTFNYDVNFNPMSVTDSSGTLASFQFNTNGTMQSGAVGYDISSQPTMASQFTYDANGNMNGRTDALGRTTSYTYDSLGHKLSMTVPLPNSNTNAAAATTNYTYDAFGDLTQTAAPLGRITSSTYDGNGNKLSDTDARGNTTTYQYDALNRLVLTTYPDGATASKAQYDFRGNVITETDQAGHVTKHVYDLAGRQTSVTQASGTSNATTTSYTYDGDGRKLSETDALGHTTTYTYDAAGNLTGVSGVGGSFTYAYDNARNRVSMTDGNEHTTGYQYDARKRLVLTAYPDGTTKTSTYDGPGNLISVTDQAGNVVEYTYDSANELKTVVQTSSPDTSANTTIVGYDADGNPIVLTDANSHTTASSFDLANEPTAKTLPDGSLTESRSYDQVGNLLSVAHFNGVTTTYTYDTLNRLLSRVTPGEATVSFTYTTTGKRASMTDASGTTTYGYDSMDRLTSKATPEGTLSYSYDAAGNLASISSNHTGGASASYTYDTLNRLSTVVDGLLSGSKTTTYTYDSASNLATATYPNGVETTFTYDSLNRATGLASQPGNYTYVLGPTGTRTSASESSGRSVTWSYDGIYRLTNETITGAPSGKNGTVAYGLDPVGNRLSESSSLSGISSGSFGYNADDEVLSETYDANGNTLTTDGKTFTYDAENRLLSMNSGAVQNLYDGDGNRVAKSVNGVVTRYLVDDLNPTGYSQVVEELSGSGSVERVYTYGVQRISENQVISSTWTPSFYAYDGMGSVRQLTSTSGAVTDTYEYDAFGNSVSTSGSTPNNYLYRGEQFDPDLGLYYLRARYYNPLTGRFMSRDPKDPEPRDANGVPVNPKSLHKYLYANGDPVNGWDPTGRGDDEVDYGFLTWNRAKAVAREFGPFFVNCFKGIIDALGSDLQVVEYRDPLYFQEILERIAARCTQGLFFNPN